jgi:hypothetical protein
MHPQTQSCAAAAGDRSTTSSSPSSPTSTGTTTAACTVEIGYLPPAEYETHWVNTKINNYPDNRVLSEAGTN